jgi:YggT family protein
VREVLCAIITTYLIILFARAIISWIPPAPGMLTTISRVLYDLTEPVLAPLRRIIPPAGVIDLSFLVLIIGLTVVRSAICG